MPQAPIARRQDGPDPYRWLESRDDDQVLAYLAAENDYTEAVLAPQAELRQALFEEIKGRIRQTDLSLPSPWGPHLYYQRTEDGQEYPRYYRCQRPADDSLAVDTASEQLLLDPNALAGGGFLSLGSLSISPDYQKLAYSLDRSGDEIYQLLVKDLATGQITELPASRADGSLTWANDSQTLFYGELDDSHRSHRILRYRLGDASATEVFHEADGHFFVHCYRSSSERQLVIQSASITTHELWHLDADTPDGQWQCLAPRQEGHQYDADHGRLNGQWCWLIRSNQAGINFAIYQASETQPQREHWQELIAHDDRRMLEEVEAKDGAFILSLRKGGLQLLEIYRDDLPPYRVRLPDAVYSLQLEDVLEFHSPLVRLRYESLNRPAQIRQLDITCGEQQILTETPVLGDFDAEAYSSLRLWAQAADGSQIPISLVGRKEVLAQGMPAPLYLYGYGAYGTCLDPWFSHARLSLLERGILFAVAHVRGGGEMGEAWYRAGKLAHKQNTFSDFIACAEQLINDGHTSAKQLIISGGSAGGLLIGAVLNQRPELFAGAIADVPFVDCLNTMLNPDLPLTQIEYDEWGDPNQPQAHERIKAYAPYENVRAQHYPAILALAGYRDSRVSYWEAAKWVAKLRASKTDDQLLLLKTDMDAGHSGMNGRYQRLREQALEYTFVLRVLEPNLRQPAP